MEKFLLNNEYKLFKFVVGQLPTNCYVILNNEKNAAIIDPGFYDSNLMEFLKKENIIPKLILLTHGHFDHFFGLNMFSNVRTLINAKDEQLLNDASKNAANLCGIENITIPKNIETFKDGDLISFEKDYFKVMETPGHTMGSSTFLFLGDILFTGDAVFKNGVGRFDLFSGSSSLTKSTIKNLSKLSGQFKIFPGHGEHTNLDDEKKYNSAFLKYCEI